ncbi:hypothetical protein AcW1_007198 [Taiwanofungus camphoratus]|nr:hypothetical protein AcW2_007733 [Antrodia cinnamomea]KAI0952810.1 hypothetical protein AcW1_007198 [Antrodia cinnamomea]
MSFSGQQEGLCLRYPENLAAQPTLTHEMAVSMLLRATQLALHTPFSWGYIDKPSEGQTFLIFITPQLPFPPDGIRFQDQEQRYVIPAGAGRELEVLEVKFGFIPGGQDSAAFRVRRRFRLHKGGHPQLVLVHYSRGQSLPIIPSLNQPVRSYPLRPVNEPSLFVMGEKMGQKVYPTAAPGAGDRQPSLPPGVGISFGGGVGIGGNPQALLAQQNSNMEALERRSQRERSGSMNPRQIPPQSRADEEDSADEADTISTRTLALTRYRRNHELMNDVFMHAAFGKNKELPSLPPPYSIFNKTDLDDKVAKLSSEIEELRAKAAARKEARLRTEVGANLDDEPVDVMMESIAVGSEEIAV